MIFSGRLFSLWFSSILMILVFVCEISNCDSVGNDASMTGVTSEDPLVLKFLSLIQLDSPDSLTAAAEICYQLKFASDFNPVISMKGSKFSLINYVSKNILTDPSLKGLAACLIQKNRLILKDLPDGGIALMHSSVVSKHLRLINAILQQGAPLLTREEEGVFGTVLHSALSFRLVTMDIFQNIIKHREINESSVSPSEIDRIFQYGHWLLSFVRTLQRHGGPHVSKRLEEAFAKIFEDSVVFKYEGNKLVPTPDRLLARMKEESFTAGRISMSTSACVDSLNVIGQSTGFLALELILTTLENSSGSSLAAMSLIDTLDFVGAMLPLDIESYGDTFRSDVQQMPPLQALNFLRHNEFHAGSGAAVDAASAVKRLLWAPDALGRTPLHSAALHGSLDTAAYLIRRVNSAAAGSSPSMAGLATLIYVAQRDSFNMTAAESACALGFPDTALGLTLVAAGLGAQVPQYWTYLQGGSGNVRGHNTLPQLFPMTAAPLVGTLLRSSPPISPGSAQFSLLAQQLCMTMAAPPMSLPEATPDGHGWAQRYFSRSQLDEYRYFLDTQGSLGHNKSYLASLDASSRAGEPVLELDQDKNQKLDQEWKPEMELESGVIRTHLLEEVQRTLNAALADTGGWPRYESPSSLFGSNFTLGSTGYQDSFSHILEQAYARNPVLTAALNKSPKATSALEHLLGLNTRARSRVLRALAAVAPKRPDLQNSQLSRTIEYAVLRAELKKYIQAVEEAELPNSAAEAPPSTAGDDLKNAVFDDFLQRPFLARGNHSTYLQPSLRGAQCDIDVVPAHLLTPELFLRHYLLRRRPVLLRHGLFALGTDLRERWSVEGILKGFQGEDPTSLLAVEVGYIPYSKNFGQPAPARITLKEYIKDVLSAPLDAPDLVQAVLVQEQEAAEVVGEYSLRNMSRSDKEGLYVFSGPGPLLSSSTDVKRRILSLLGPVPLVPWFLDASFGSSAVKPRSGELGKSGGLLNVSRDDYIGNPGVESIYSFRTVHMLSKDPSLLTAHPVSGDSDSKLKKSENVGWKGVPYALPLVSMQPVPNPQFYLGGPGTGAPMHLHKDAWNALVYGRKRWFLQVPSASQYSVKPVSRWVWDDLDCFSNCGEEGMMDPDSLAGASLEAKLGDSVYGNARNDNVIECTQEAGDIIYVPSGWGHAVLNLETSIGVAVEFTTPVNKY